MGARNQGDPKALGEFYMEGEMENGSSKLKESGCLKGRK